jgi:twitching motility two-component system response regulator PilH
MKKKILHVDDSQTDQEFFSGILTEAGYEMLVASNGEEGIEKAREQHPDLILMDVNMSKMDGFAATEIIKKDPKLHDISVIILTAMDRPTDIIKGLEVNADGFLRKVDSPEELIQQIERLFISKEFRDSGKLEKLIKKSDDENVVFLRLNQFEIITKYIKAVGAAVQNNIGSTYGTEAMGVIYKSAIKKTQDEFPFLGTLTFDIDGVLSGVTLRESTANTIPREMMLKGFNEFVSALLVDMIKLTGSSQVEKLQRELEGELGT